MQAFRGKITTFTVQSFYRSSIFTFLWGRTREILQQDVFIKLNIARNFFWTPSAEFFWSNSFGFCWILRSKVSKCIFVYFSIESSWVGMISIGQAWCILMTNERCIFLVQTFLNNIWIVYICQIEQERSQLLIQGSSLLFLH